MEIYCGKQKGLQEEMKGKQKLNLVTNDNWIHKLEDYNMKI